MEIRNPNKTHWPSLEPMILEALGPGWDAESLSARIFYDEAYDPNHVWFAREAGKMLGFLHSTLEGGIARIKLLVVAPAARRKGLGRDMLGRAEYRLSGEGAEEAWIAPSPPNEFCPGLVPGSEAEAFFRAQGYEADGETELRWAAPAAPAPALEPNAGVVDFAKWHCGDDWGWAEECLSHRPPRAVFRDDTGLILFAPGESVGPLWPAEDADKDALGRLAREALAAASVEAPRDPRGLRLHESNGSLPPLAAAATEKRLYYRKTLT